jgi:ankyrin repeat protein
MAVEVGTHRMNPRTFPVLALALAACGCGLSRIGETTPLIEAARAGDIPHLEKLLAGGADPNQRAGVNDWTPLMHAIHKGQKDSVRVLLRHDADVNAKTGNGGTALIEAAGYGYSEIVAMLLEARAKPDVRDKDGYTALNAATGGVPDIDRLTVGHCQTETVRVLLQHAPQLRLQHTLADDMALRVAKFAGCSEIVKLVKYQ